MGTNRQLAAAGHGVDGINDQVYEDFAQLGRVAADEQVTFRVEGHIDVEAVGARFILPARAGDFDRIAQQVADVQKLEFSIHRFPREGLNAAHGGGGVLGGGNDDAEAAD